MSGVKTAISLDRDLFEKVNKLAHEMHVSRSRLFTIAVQDYLRKQENHALLAQLNDAYEDHLNGEERKLVASMKSKQRQQVGREPW